MASGFRNWLHKFSPIPPAGLFEVQVQNTVDQFIPSPETFISECPILFYVPFSEDYLSQPNYDVSDNLCIDSKSNIVGEDNSFFEYIQSPIIDDFLVLIKSSILIVDLFIKLGSSPLAGRSYADDEQLKKEQLALPLETPNYDRTICRHGIRRYECALCEEEEEKRKRKLDTGLKIKALDLFQLLLPILMPPLDKWINNQALFPANARPFPYQIEGIKFLKNNKSALLGDEMGLGKTIQAIVAIRLLMQKGMIRNTLVVCPLSLIGNWKKEFEKWAPELSVTKVKGVRDVRKLFWKSPFNVYVTTYETLREDIDNNFITSKYFSLVVLDEVQKIKNPETKIARALQKLKPDYRWGLSGTPLENKLEDVIAIFRFLRPELRFYSTINSYQVKETIKPYFLRRKICDVEKDLPEKVVQEYWIDLNTFQQAAYDKAYAEARSDIQGRETIDRIHIFSWINKLKLICNEEENSGDSCKKDFLIDQLESIPPDDKAIVFSQFPEKTLSRLLVTLQPYDPAMFSGKDSSNKRDEIIQQFMKTESPRILLASLKAGGVGINLQRANRIFHFDHWWNPAVTKQAEGRAHRKGQEKTVFVYDLFTNGTIEEKIYQILLTKQNLFDEVIDDLSSSASAAKLTDEELFGLFDLKPPTLAKPPSVNSRNENQKINAEEIKHQIGMLDPSGFERLIGKLFSSKGYQIEIIGGARDGGVDVIARGSTRVGIEKINIQCKHYFNRQVGPSVIREAIGTKQISTVDRMFIITSGTFSDEAIKLANSHNMKLMDISQLIGEIISNKISV